MQTPRWIFVLIALCWWSCWLGCRAVTAGVPTLPPIDTSTTANGVVPLPASVDPVFQLFDRYTKVTAPGGGAIHILIQNAVTDEQAVHAREVMRSHLTDYPGSLYGQDKSGVADAMAANQAILALFNNEGVFDTPEAEALFESGVNAQDLLGTEIIPEGTAGYLQSPPVRDATYEEVIHLIHNYGITEALPAMQAALDTALANAMAQNLYRPLGDLPMADWDDEYLAIGMEVYFGIWALEPVAGGNEYDFTTRESLASGDPALLAVLEGFFTPQWSYTARVDAGFTGNFHLDSVPGTDYTLRSRYLSQVQLSGNLDSDLTGNDHDNVLAGNPGDNTLRGGPGIDIAVFTGPSMEYSMVQEQGCLRVTDLQSGRDGSDCLTEIEVLRFSDGDLANSSIFADAFESGDLSAWSSTSP